MDHTNNMTKVCSTADIPNVLTNFNTSKMIVKMYRDVQYMYIERT